MAPPVRRLNLLALLLVLALGALAAFPTTRGGEPPALNPFGPTESARDDAVPGFVELSDGTAHPGQVLPDARRQAQDL